MNEEIKKGLEIQIEKLAVQAWTLHKKLSGEYKSTSEQFEDMVKLGELAQVILAIRKARNLI